MHDEFTSPGESTALLTNSSVFSGGFPSVLITSAWLAPSGTASNCSLEIAWARCSGLSVSTALLIATLTITAQPPTSTTNAAPIPPSTQGHFGFFRLVGGTGPPRIGGA